MKKFTQSIGAIHEAEAAGKSELQKSYQDYFSAKLTKYGVKSPAELETAKKSEFFNEISKDWERGQGATEAGKADVEKHGVKESQVNEGHPSTDPYAFYSTVKDLKDDLSALEKYWKGQSMPEWAKKKKAFLEYGISNAKEVGIKESVNEGHPSTDPYAFYSTVKDLKDDLSALEKYWKGQSMPEWAKKKKAFLEYGISNAKEVGIKESVNEADVKSDNDFKEYAQNILKKAHKDDYDEKKADATIDGILKKADGDYGKAVGILNNSLG